MDTTSFFWKDIFNMLPVQVFIDYRTNSYNVRDNSLMVVWSDDLPYEKPAQILDEIAQSLTPASGKQFLSIFENIQWLYEAGMRPQLILYPADREDPMFLEVTLSRGSKGKRMELRFEEWDAKEYIRLMQDGCEGNSSCPAIQSSRTSFSGKAGR